MSEPLPNTTFPDLPKAITSFGAAVLGDDLYVLGGHFGKAHHYYDAGQSGDLLRCSLARPKQWEVVATGPRIQGLSLVAYGGSLYRIGGFTARNDVESEQDLWSSAEFCRFDPESNTWSELAPLPVPRSSFDATVVNGTLYVAGGWTLAGDRQATWPEVMLAADLREAQPTWRALPSPGEARRAVSMGASGGQVFLMGGMRPAGEISPGVSVFDPATEGWSDGPELPGDGMAGFGSAACELGDRLYVSTAGGALLRLSAAGRRWEEVARHATGRFFHQIVPAGERRLLAIGGANMERGKFATVEVLDLPD